ncbi:MAG: DUF2284 domain-containing protein [Oscillospiraceae bacterium]|nr:DUF2284 domain-containing protein [Oscillospiraceae bacterium]
MEEWVRQAMAFGFSHAAPAALAALRVRPEVRDMCAADRCRLYGRSWMCPPACGRLEDIQKQLHGCSAGLLVQTTGALEDDFDYETMEAAGKKQKELFRAFRRVLAPTRPGLLALSSGGCALCPACAYPDAPCRLPGEALPSMEAFGLVVSEVCRDSGLPYYYGPGTITYTGCYLW